MSLKSTANLKHYSQNLDILADKPGNLAELIEELQTKVAALATLANQNKAITNAGTGSVTAPDVTI